jgi:predicted nuclease of predicted toxin-antitoxin system
MPNRIRFHLDEHGDPRIARGLRRRGIDVTTTVDAGLLHATDEEQLAYATSEGRMLFTHDAGFLRLHAAGSIHTGIAFCHAGSRSVGEIIRRLTLIWEIYDPEEMDSRVEFL